MMDVRFHVCSRCGNIIVSTGEAKVECCGRILPALTAGVSTGTKVEIEGDEYVIPIHHPMTKDHYFMFFAAVSESGVQLARLSPGKNTKVRFRSEGVKQIYMYCTVHGLYVKEL